MSVRLLPFSLELYDDLVDMHYKFITEIYGDKRRINSKYFFHKTIQSWIDNRREIAIAVKDSEVVGYSLSYIDDMGGLTEPVYKGEFIYVKEYARKSRTAYLLYNNIIERAKELDMNVSGGGRADNGADKMLEKHFGDGSGKERMFSTYERKK